MYQRTETISGALLEKDRFWGWTDVKGMLEYTGEIGLGSTNYRLLEVE